MKAEKTWKLISRFYVGLKKIDEAHVRGIVGNEASEEEVRNEKEEILRIKAKVQEYGRDKIQQIQFEEAINQGLEVHQ